MADLPKSVTILDDTMREGLQIEDRDISISQKLKLLDALGETGAKLIVVGLFANPELWPQMANVDDLVERFVPKPGVTYAAIGLDPEGLERAKRYYPKINVARVSHRTNLELSNTFLMRTFNMTMEQQMAGWPEAIERARAEGEKEGHIAVGSPWGSNFEGDIAHEQVMKVLEMQVDLWHESGFIIQSVAFLDAMGWNMPHRVRRTLETVREKWPEITEVQCHFHNTRGMALASYYEALQVGARQFAACVGGMGGCPYCGNGRAAGLPPTEDFVLLCEEMGIETGYNIEKLVEAAETAEEVVGHALWGHVSKAGPLPRGNRLYPKGLPFIETLEEAAHFRISTG